jgi:uncharacterized SAM-binding protein YcdF (DUF218 family)
MLVVVVTWVAGLVWFSQQMPRRVEDPFAVTDAIVVLTGGAGRLGTGLELLAQGRAGKLFVSGVYRGVDVDEILRISRQAPDALECCIEVGHDATDTTGNARETARWMAAEGLHSLRLVTASYHMPRSLTEFRRVMPDIELVPHPVFTDAVPVEAWWSSPQSLALITSEFTKYLVGLARLAPSPSE